ncbi:MAG: 50S ribosomal protein L20 [bacterium]
MPRVTTGAATRQRRRKWLSQAKGYWGSRSKLYRPARLQVMHGLISAYRERKRKKRTYRALWITRINSALRPHGMNYSTFIHGLVVAGLELDRTVLSEMAIHSPEDFAGLVETVRAALEPEAKS